MGHSAKKVSDGQFLNFAVDVGKGDVRNITTYNFLRKNKGGKNLPTARQMQTYYKRMKKAENISTKVEDKKGLDRISDWGDPYQYDRP